MEKIEDKFNEMLNAKVFFRVLKDFYNRLEIGLEIQYRCQDLETFKLVKINVN